MLHRSHLLGRRILLSLTLAAALPALSQVSVITRGYDNQRTGTNLSETILNQSNVNASQFGKLFQLEVDEQVFAQVLYMHGLSIAGGTHNVIFVASANNTIYAFDADTAGAPLWQRNFNNGGRPTNHTEVGGNCNPYLDFSGNIGIVGSPVIDASTNTMYFVARTVENGATVQRLRAINVTTGADRAANAQVAIQASGFDPVIQNQRPSLALSSGVLYIGWASFCDTGAYHGWFMSYDATSFSQLGVFNTTASGSQGGIWMSGIAPAFDSNGNVYFSTGNGTFDGSSNFGESLLKLAPRTLNRLDSFTPSNFNTLNGGDTDFGSGGPLFLPGTNVIATGGKEGKIFVINSNNLGGVVTGDTQILQSFQAVDPTVVPNATYHIHNGSVAWNGPQGLNLYISGENDHVRAYRFNPSTQTFTTPAFATGAFLLPRGMPGSMLALSSNGSQSGTGVLWSYTPRLGDANQKVVPGVLTAYNAETLAQLWMSGTNPGDDTFNYSKGSTPTIVGGKVYLASFSNIISVYGLRTSASSQNLALNKAATGSASCNANETPDKAVNGSYSGGNTDKWCSLVTPSFLQVDLGTNSTINQVVVEHAGAGGEGGSLDSSGRPNFDINTSAYNIQVSTDGTNFTTVVSASGNLQSITTHNIAPVPARFVKLNVTTPTRTTDTASRIYEFQVYGPPGSIAAPDFSLSASPGSLTVPQGSNASSTVTVSPSNGFSSSVSLSASGLPSGVTASFNPSSTTGTSTVTLTASSTAATGTSTVTVTGTSGNLTHTTTISLTVNATSGNTAVNLSSAFNVSSGIVTDGTTFTGGGLDGGGRSYSANLLGSTQTFNGTQFNLGPANAADAVDNATIALPAGRFSALKMLAAAVNGNQASQTFTVTYTDNTTQSFIQSVSDWAHPQNFAGESIAVTMAHRDISDGTTQVRTVNLFAYSFGTNNGKTVKSIALPNSRNVVVLAITLVP
ncbi:MAG TPA: discoidin domain-containing protein [Candidatus Angelobacter sp.]|nr:discoidin domain-containing protein [Candidatus Angelobacter sp.]